ncbi:MAG: hypothetical protein KAY24_01155 [Candidatus Eisenbacteria sp.]|nr:hypothetical protein [Candidatus Eisenbacteria bacterium]
MSAWPATLPEYPLRSSYAEGQQDNTIRSPNDAGPANVRARFTAVVVAFDVAYLLTSAQVNDLMDFYNDTLEYGTQRFWWNHPRTRASVECRFATKPGLSRNGAYYGATFQVEVMP